MLLKISMSTEDIRLINFLRENLKDIAEIKTAELKNLDKAVELLNRIFYGYINQKMLEDEQGNPDGGLPCSCKSICQKSFHELRKELQT